MEEKDLEEMHYDMKEIVEADNAGNQSGNI